MNEIFCSGSCYPQDTRSFPARRSSDTRLFQIRWPSVKTKLPGQRSFVDQSRSCSMEQTSAQHQAYFFHQLFQHACEFRGNPLFRGTKQQLNNG